MTFPVTPPIYDIGDRPIVTGAFKDAAGVVAAPSLVTVKVLPPSGTVATYTSPDASLVVGSSTVFTFPEPLDEEGTWYVNMKGDAGVQAAAEIEFVVRASRFP